MHGIRTTALGPLLNTPWMIFQVIHGFAIKLMGTAVLKILLLSCSPLTLEERSLQSQAQAHQLWNEETCKPKICLLLTAESRHPHEASGILLPSKHSSPPSTSTECTSPPLTLGSVTRFALADAIPTNKIQEKGNGFQLGTDGLASLGTCLLP